MNISANQGAFDPDLNKSRPDLQEKTKTPQKTGDQAVSRGEEDSAQAAKPRKSQEKLTFNCRDHCMHCGKHCIYLNIK